MSLPVAWMVDVDGTLALSAHRNPYDWRRSGDDLPNVPVIMGVQAPAKNPNVSAIIAISGRHEQARELTSRWLDTYAAPHHELVMRPDSDDRRDHVVKEELFRERTLPRYAVAGSSTTATGLFRCGADSD